MATPRPERLSAREARWLAVEAQQLARPRPRARSGASAAQVERVARALAVVQLDAINVVERTQFFVLFSRLGAYEREHLHRLIEPGGGLWEYWGHAASLMPADDEPLLRWRYEDGGTYVPGPVVKARFDAWEAASASYVASVMEEVRERGPLTAGSWPIRVGATASGGSGAAEAGRPWPDCTGGAGSQPGGCRRSRPSTTCPNACCRRRSWPARRRRRPTRSERSCRRRRAPAASAR